MRRVCCRFAGWRGLCLVAVYHGGNGVCFVSVMVVVVLRVFDVGVHGAGGVVSVLVGVFEMMPAVRVSRVVFVAFVGERVAVVEGGGWWCVLRCFRWWCGGFSGSSCVLSGCCLG